MATVQTKLPEGVGRLSRGWWLFMSGAGVLFIFGLIAYLREATEGLTATGMRNVGTMGGATWGLYIAVVVYFMGIAFAGIAVALIIRLFDLKKLRPLARMAEVLTVVSLVLGALAIIVDLGQPIRGLFNLFRYARPQSPFFGTFSLVIAGYLAASLIYLYLGSRRDAAVMARTPSRLQGLHRFIAAGYTDTPEERERHRRTSYWLAIAILPLLVIATSTLGFVFGLQVGRPGWFSALQAPAFVVLGGVSGVGLLIILAAAVRRAGYAKDRLGEEVFSWLGTVLLVLTLVYLYFMTTEVLTATYAGGEREVAVSEAILTGTYAPIFWVSVALFVLAAGALAYQTVLKRWSLGLLVGVGVAVNLAALGKRYLIAVPSQTHGSLLPYETGSYSPTWVEYGVVLGLIGLGILIIGWFMKFIPIVPLEREEVS